MQRRALSPNIRTDARERVREVRVGRGVFCLQFARSSSAAAPPTIWVDDFDSSSIQFLTSVDKDTLALVEPGDWILLRSARESVVTLTVEPSAPGGSIDAELHLAPFEGLDELLSKRTPLRQELARSASRVRHLPNAAPATWAPVPLRIVAHVARRGDVVVQNDEWICGPEIPMAIEGLRIDWLDDAPAADIRLTLTVKERGRRALKEVGVGTFAGTRGRAAPIVELVMRLAGEDARLLKINCEALFLGSHVVKAVGSEIRLHGPTQSEPLVGLKLSLSQAETERRTAPADADFAQHDVRAGNKIEKIERGGRVRVFRRSPQELGPIGVVGKQ